MKFGEIFSLISNPKADSLRPFFNKLSQSPRNATIDIHRDYFAGKHWELATSGNVTTTRSGKVIWGKRPNRNGNANDVLNRRERGRTNRGYDYGQVQTHNYSKLFIQIYQEYLLGNNPEGISIYVEGDESTDTLLSEPFSELADLLKWQVARLIPDTVAVQSISYVDGKYVISPEDPREIFPVYRGMNQVGTIRVVVIEPEEAKSYGVSTESEAPVMADVYLEVEGQWVNWKFVDGYVVGITKLPSEISYDPYTWVANINHPFQNFDEHHLEDSEFFNWVDRMDALNANETLEFVSNQWYAAPKPSLDMQAVKDLNIDLRSPEFQQALSEFQFSSGDLTSMPVIAIDGKTINDSFYKGKQTLKDALFEDAGIPEFLINGNMSGVSTETVKLGMSMLVRKIHQKRDQLSLLMRLTAQKILKGNGKNYELKDIRVNFPPVLAMEGSELLSAVNEAVDRNLLPEKFGTKLYLEQMNRIDDLEAVEADMDGQGQGVMEEVEKRKQAVRGAMLEEQLKKQQQSQLEKANRVKSELESLS